MRRFRMPSLTMRAFVFVALAITAVCAAFAVSMRASLTDYNSWPDELGSLPYVTRTAWSQSLSSESAEEELASADLVVVAICRDGGTYVYQSFLREFEVVEVLRGEDVDAGLAIWTYDDLAISQPRNYTGKGQFSTDRVVTAMGMGPCSNGATPLREGETYVLFLTRKQAVSSKDEPRYVQVNSPYAHIRLTDGGEGLRVDVFSANESGECPRIPFADASSLDLAVSSDADAALYLETCDEVLASLGLKDEAEA